MVFELPTWPKPPPLPADQLRSTRVVGGKEDGGDDESRSATRVPWEEKISPFLLVAERKKVRTHQNTWRFLHGTLFFSCIRIFLFFVFVYFIFPRKHLKLKIVLFKNKRGLSVCLL